MKKENIIKKVSKTIGKIHNRHIRILVKGVGAITILAVGIAIPVTIVALLLQSIVGWILIGIVVVYIFGYAVETDGKSKGGKNEQRKNSKKTKRKEISKKNN